jgi:NitT/TauT family transport system substrate-binding protein
MKTLYDQHGDGIDESKIHIEHDAHCGGLFGRCIHRRDVLTAGGLAALGAGLPMPSFAQEKKWNPVIKICYLPITDASALLVAHELGLFKKEGIDSEAPTLIRGWSPMVEAFAAHRFNLTHLLKPIPIWMRYNNKFTIKITAWGHTNGSAIVVGGKTGINSPKDFGGKQFAVPFWYSMHNIVSQRIMKAAGIKPVIRPQDAKLAPDECNYLVLQPPAMPPALAAGTIDGYCVAEPFNALGELKAGGKLFRFTGDAWKGHPCCVVVMHEADVMDPDRAAWTQGVHNAIVAAQIHLAENREAMATMLSADGKNYLPFPKEVVIRAMMFYDPAYYKNPHAIKHPEWGQNRINFQGWPYRSATERITNDLKETVITGDARFLEGLSAKHVADDLVNYTFIKKALEANPKWRADKSVPQSGDPYTRVEVFQI